jgi:hypothetical protein
VISLKKGTFEGETNFLAEAVRSHSKLMTAVVCAHHNIDK